MIRLARISLLLLAALRCAGAAAQTESYAAWASQREAAAERYYARPVIDRSVALAAANEPLASDASNDVELADVSQRSAEPSPADGPFDYSDDNRFTRTPFPFLPREDFSLSFFSGADVFRGPSDTDRQNNFGTVVGTNLGTLLPGQLGARGIGAQFGASYGIYDWDGRGVAQTARQQTQWFLTGGFFRRATLGHGWNAGIVYDVMLNEDFGTLAQHPTLTQFRGTLAYAISPCHEIGCWATHRDRSDQSGFALNLFPTATQFQLVNQANFFDHRQWEFGGETWVWAGLVEPQRLSGSGSLGDWTLGGMLRAPLSDSCAVYGGTQYVHPSAAAGAEGATESFWNVSVGVVFYPRCQARCGGIACGDGSPMLPVASNGSMLVDYRETRPGFTVVSGVGQ